MRGLVNFVSPVTMRSKLSILDGAAYSCGGSELYEEGLAFVGHLGLGDEWGEPVSEPRPMLFGLQVSLPCCVVAVAAGNLHSLVLCEDGSLYSCGGGWEGPLGLGDQASHAHLQQVSALASERIVAVAAGAAHSLAITREGSLYTWGWGAKGQLGHGGTTSEMTPRLLTALSSTIIEHIAAGPTHSIASACGGAVQFGTTPDGILHEAPSPRMQATMATKPEPSPLAEVTGLMSMPRPVSLTELSKMPISMRRNLSVNSLAWSELACDETEEVAPLPTEKHRLTLHGPEASGPIHDGDESCDSHSEQGSTLSAARTYDCSLECACHADEAMDKLSLHVVSRPSPPLPSAA